MSSTPTTSPRRRLAVQLSRFTLVGVLNTGIDLLVLNTATFLSGITTGTGYAIQKAGSFFVAAAFSYAMNKRWTFADTSRGGAGRKLAQFYAVSVLGAALNVSVATAVVTHLRPLVVPLAAGPWVDQLWVNLGALAGTAAGSLWNFLGYKRVVFRA